MLKISTVKSEWENRKNKGGLLGGLGYVGGSIAAGIGGIGEGILDLGAAGIALLGGDKEYAKYVFKDNVVGDWHQSLTEDYNPGKVMQFIGDVGQGLGQSATMLIPYVGVPAFFLGVGSQGISGAAEKTGDVGFKEVAYGATTGAIEGTLEWALGAAGQGAKSIASAIFKRGGKGAAKTLFSTAVRRGLAGKILSSAAGEFLEEAASEVVDVGLQRLYRIDPNASTSLKDVLYAGIVGAVSGGIMGGSVNVVQTLNNRATGRKIVQDGNAQTLINTANLVADKLAGQGTNFRRAPEWVKTLRGEIDAYNKLVEKGEQNSAKGETILGELQASLFFAETQAVASGLAYSIQQSSDENRATLAEYVNQTIPKDKRAREYTAEDIAKDTDGITMQLAILQFAGNEFINYADAISSLETDQAQEGAIGDVVGAMQEESAETVEAGQSAETPSTADAVPSVSTKLPPPQAVPLPQEGGIESAAQNQANAGIFDASAGVSTEGEVAKSDLASPLTDAKYSVATAKRAQKRIKENAARAEKARQARLDEEGRMVEGTNQEQSAERKNEPSPSPSSDGATSPEVGGNNEPKIRKPKEILTDAQRAERAKERAKKLIEYEATVKVTSKELNTAREYIKDFDNLPKGARQAVIKMIRSSDGKVDKKILAGVANLMTMRRKNGELVMPDLELRFAEGIVDGGLYTHIGEGENRRVLILINSDADFKDTIRGTIAHEVVHYIENRKGYRELADYVLKTAKKEKIAEIEKEYNEHYKGIYAAEAEKAGLTGEAITKKVAEIMATEDHKELIKSEVVAKLIGLRLNNEKFLKKYATKDDAMIKKILRFLRASVSYLKDKDKATADEVTRLVNVFSAVIGSSVVSEEKTAFDANSSADKQQETIENNIKNVKQMSPVANISGEEFRKGEVDLVTQVSDFFDNQGNVATSLELGEVTFDRRGVKDDIAHGIGRKKAASFAAVPDVIKNGKVVDYQKNWKDRGYDTAVIAAPIKINGEPHLMGIVLIKEQGNQRFYVHEVLSIEEGAALFKTGTVKNNGDSGSDAPSVISILQKIAAVNSFEEKNELTRTNSEKMQDTDKRDLAPRKADKAEKKIEKLEKEKAEAQAKAKQERSMREKLAREAAPKQIEEWEKPITLQDVQVLRSIGQKSINNFTSAEIQIAQKWAYKFYKEFGVKSPFFRAWFGEWRAHTISPSNIVSFEYGEYPSITISERSVFNADMNRLINIDSDTFDDSYHYANINKDKKPIKKLLGKIDEIIEKAIWLDTRISKKTSENKKGSTQFMHYLYTPVSINGAPFIAKLTVEEYDLIGKTRAYNLQRIELSDLPRAQYAQLISENKEKYAYKSDALSIAQLYEFVKSKDENFIPAPEVSKYVLNEEGTPKVFYHGTRKENGEFWEFDYSKAKKKGGLGFKTLGAGNYFTSEKLDGTELYGSRVIEAYLSVKNPLVVRLNSDFRDVVSQTLNINASQMTYPSIQKAMRDANYDGVVKLNEEGKPAIVVTFDGEQIKSAVKPDKPGANIGTFDKTNPNIKRDLAPRKADKAVKTKAEQEANRGNDVYFERAVARAATEEAESTKRSNEAYKEGNKILNQKIKNQKKLTDDLVSEITTLDDRIAHLEAQNEAYKEGNKTLNELLSAARKRRNKAVIELEELRAEFEKLQKQNEAYKEGNKKINKKLDESRSETAKLKRENRSLAQQIAQEAYEADAKTFTQKEIDALVERINQYSTDKFKDIMDEKKATISKIDKDQFAYDVYVAFHTASSDKRVMDRMEVFADKLAKKYLDDVFYLNDGKRVYLKDIFDEASYKQYVNVFRRKIIASFKQMGRETTHARLTAHYRAEMTKLQNKLLDTEAKGKNLRELQWQAKQLRTTVDVQKRSPQDEGIYNVEKEMSRIADERGRVSAKQADKAFEKFYVFLTSDSEKADSSLAEMAQVEGESLVSLIEEYKHLRKGHEGKYLNSTEMAIAAKIIAGGRKILREYNRVFYNGHWVDMKTLAEESVKDLTSFSGADKEYKTKVGKFLGEKLGKTLNQLYFYNVLSPETVIEALEGFKKNGVLKTLYHTVRVATQKAEHVSVQLKKPFAEFLDKKENAWTDDDGKKHSFRNKLDKKMINVNGAEITLGEAIYLYMLTKREHAHLGLKEGGYVTYDQNNHQKNNGIGIKIYDVDAAQSFIFGQFDSTDKAFLEMAEKFFNETATKIKYDADMKILGYTNNQDGYYVPIIRDRYERMANVTDQRQSIGSIVTVYNKSFTQNLVQNAKALEGKNIMEIINDHADGLADYSELYLPLKSFDRIYNARVINDKAQATSIRKVLNTEVWKGSDNYFKKLFADIQGQGSERGFLDGMIGKLRSGWVNSVLGANVKVVVTQTTSYVAANQLIEAKYLSAAASKLVGNIDEIRERAYKYSDIIETRNFEMGSLRAQGNIDKVNEIGKKSGFLIGWMDERICLSIFHAAELKAEAQGHGAVGTESNSIAAAKIADEVIYTTQAMTSQAERSALQRSKSEVAKTLSMFTSDSVKQLSHLYRNVMQFVAHKQRAKSDTAYEADLKKDAKMIGRSAATVMMTGIMLGLITQAFKYLYAKEEEEPEEKVKDFAIDMVSSTLNIMPIVSDIADKFVFGYDLSLNVFDIVNDTIEDTSALFKMTGKAMGGQYVSNAEVGKNLINAAKTYTTLFGVPLAPVERTISGLLRRFTPSAVYGYDAMFKNPSYTADLQRAVEKGDERLAEHILGQLYRNEVTGVYASEELEIVADLYSKGYTSVLPQRVGETINDVKLDKKQRQQFNKIYAQASSKVMQMIATTEFKELSEEQQAKAIKNLYSLYYNRAASTVAGKEVSNAQMYSWLTDNYSALFTSQAYKGGLDVVKNDKGKEVSVRDQFVEYAQNFGLTESDLLVVKFANGVRDKKTKAAFIDHINTLTLSDEQKAVIAEKLSLEVKDGKLVEKKE